MFLRTALKTSAAQALAWPPLADLLQRRRGGGIPFIACYHRVVARVDDRPGRALPAMETSVAMFERHLDWIARRFRIVPLDELAAGLSPESRPSPIPLAAITFDDGYADVYEHAVPLLKRKGIPAAFFVVTDLVGTSELPWHERLYAALAARHPAVPDPFAATQRLLQRLSQADVRSVVHILTRLREASDRPAALRLMTWEMLADLRDAGMTIGSHTRTHAFLANEPSSRIAAEVAQSRRILEGRLRTPVRYFAYPGGSFTASVVSAVARAGYRGAFTICRHRDTGHPLLTVPRTVLWERSCLDHLGRFSPALLSCHTAGLLPRDRCRHL